MVDDLGEESCIHLSDLEALVDEKVTKAFIPSPRCLLEPVERLVQPINTIRISRVLKPGRLSLALLSLTNYSASAQRLIVTFTREYTWDIESKER